MLLLYITMILINRKVETLSITLAKYHHLQEMALAVLSALRKMRPEIIQNSHNFLEIVSKSGFFAIVRNLFESKNNAENS